MLYYIYKICCDDLPNFIYVGSTRAYRQRKAHHKSSCNNEKSSEYNKKLYQTIRANGGWDKWRMGCIGEVDVDSKRQAEAVEETYRVKLQANLNSNRCFTTEEQKKEYRKEYYENNSDKIKEYRQKNSQKIKECSKKYYENNAEQIKKNSKEYYKNNSQKIKAYKTTKYECECGGKFTFQHKTAHIKTDKHQKYLAQTN